jgi:chromosome condensin MukBEF MukE localization factor
MAIDKLGPKGLQQQGTTSHSKVYDQSVKQVLECILDELKLIRTATMEAYDLDIERRDLEEK